MEIVDVYGYDELEPECNHEWVIEDSSDGEGRSYCLLCGADGDA